MVSAHALVPVGSLVLVERIGRKIEHAVIERLVLEYGLVGLAHGERIVVLVLLDEHVVVKVTTVHRPHVGKAQHDKRRCGITGAHLARAVDEQQRKAYCHHPEAPPCVGREYVVAYVGYVVCVSVHHGRVENLQHVLQHGLLGIRKAVAEERSRSNGEKQANAGRHSARGVEQLGLVAQQLGLGYYLGQTQRGEQRD